MPGVPSQEAFGAPRFDEYSPAPSLGTEEEFGIIRVETNPVPEDVFIYRPNLPLTLPERFSGVVLDQNAIPTASFPLDDPNNYQYWQEFRFPRDYPRGQDFELRIPPLTGFQIFASIDPGYEDVAAFDWTIQRYEIGEGWQDLTAGTTIGAPAAGDEVWVNAYLDQPLAIPSSNLEDQFRIGLRGRSGSGTFKKIVGYTGTTLSLDGQQIQIVLQPGVPYHFIWQGVPSVLLQDPVTQKVYFSVEQGLSGIWASSPNPLRTQGSQALDESENPLLISGQEASLNFRILAGIAEEGTDFLGNKYRSIVAQNNVDNIAPDTDSFWLSKPNPSQFAVENLYFDLSDNLVQPRTVDRLFLDPITTGVYFSIYYSSEGDPGTDDASWENKLWTRVPEIFHATKRGYYVLPEPATARYFKLEFTHLQAQWYAPGGFQRPIVYKKHPKWVLDYFLARIEASSSPTEDPFIAGRLQVEYNALDLAYNYYLDDLGEDPLTPAQIAPYSAGIVDRYLAQRTDTSDSIDIDTLQRIKTELAPYTTSIPSTGSGLDYLLSTYSLGARGQLQVGGRVITIPTTNELVTPAPLPGDNVSTLDRTALIGERTFPVMYFFIPSRHRYRIVSADLRDDKAFFVGLKEVAFLRDKYAVPIDSAVYIESGGDTLNVGRTDFVQQDGTLVTYAT